MEYHIDIAERRIEVEWEGFSLNRTTFVRYNSRSMQYKAYLYLPRSPMSHIVCMRRRIYRFWERVMGTGVLSARKIQSAIRQLGLKNGLYVDDAKLVPLMEQLGMDDISADLDLIGYYQAGSRRQQKTIFLFGFNPDDLSHYLENVVVRGTMLNYGRNGDLSL